LIWLVLVLPSYDLYCKIAIHNIALSPLLYQCRSVAAVVVGNPDGFEGVPTTFTNRWRRLHGRTVDLVILGDTHNIEREVKEVRMFDFIAGHVHYYQL